MWKFGFWQSTVTIFSNGIDLHAGAKVTGKKPRGVCTL